MKPFSLAVCRGLFLVAIAGSPCFAQPAGEAKSKFGFRVGERPFLGVATAASGEWAERYPFNPQTFGLTNGYSPASSHSQPAVVVYTRSMDESFFNLALSIDSLLDKDASVLNAGIYLFDKKGAQRGGYTAEELSDRIRQIQNIAKSHGLKRLSIAIAANNSPAPDLRINDEHDVTILLTKPNEDPGRRASTHWIQHVNTLKLNDASRRAIVESLSAAIKEVAPTTEGGCCW